MDGFIAYVKSKSKHKRLGRNAGGLVMLIRKSLSKWVKEIYTKSDDVIWVRINDDRRKVDLTIGCTYNHPESSAYHNNNFF